jgi:hypothetical protein
MGGKNLSESRDRYISQLQDETDGCSAQKYNFQTIDIFDIGKMVEIIIIIIVDFCIALNPEETSVQSAFQAHHHYAPMPL